MKTTILPKVATALFLTALTASADNLIPNGTFEKAAADKEWPEGWGDVPGEAGAIWGKEDDNRFLRLESPAPGAQVILYQEVKIPEGTKKLKISWRQRVTDLEIGKESWYDARILLEFADADRNKIAKPKAPNTRRDTRGWEKKETTIEVPEGAVYLKFMPSLFQVASGTFDIDDVVIEAD